MEEVKSEESPPTTSCLLSYNSYCTRKLFNQNEEEIELCGLLCSDRMEKIVQRKYESEYSTVTTNQIDHPSIKRELEKYKGIIVEEKKREGITGETIEKNDGLKNDSPSPIIRILETTKESIAMENAMKNLEDKKLQAKKRVYISDSTMKDETNGVTSNTKNALILVENHEKKKPKVEKQSTADLRKLQMQLFQQNSLTSTVSKYQDLPVPKWHPPWKLKRVIAGHLGWVRSIAMDPTNEWFATGSADRTIKLWDLITGQLKLTLTGHINCIRGLAVSPRHPYLFSAAEDKKVLCWDLEYNKVIRSYHGHLSGVYCLKLHPTLDILVTGGRDSVARVWDMRTKQQIHCLSGHQGTVWSLETEATDPQVITGADTIKLWDLAAGKVMTTLTHHKKMIRCLTNHPDEHTFVSGSSDNIKKWHTKTGKFLLNYSGRNHTSFVVNTLSANADGVLVSGADNGNLTFWDYKTGYCFQKEKTIVQPGSLDSEAGIYAGTFDLTGMRYITCEADKTIKVWHEDTEATQESHPIDMKSWKKEVLADHRS